MDTPLSLALLSLSASASYIFASDIADKLIPPRIRIPDLELPNILPRTFSPPINIDNIFRNNPSTMPSDSELAAEALHEEATLRFNTFTSEQAVTIGMNLRKRFRASSRHVSKGKGCVISIQTMQGATLFACSVGEGSDVSLDSWWRVEGMIKIVRRTGHSTFYVEKGISAIGRNPEQLGLPFPEYRIDGGAFPVWLTSSSITPIAVIAVYSGSSLEDHHLIVSTLKSYFNKIEGSRAGSSVGHRDD